MPVEFHKNIVENPLTMLMFYDEGVNDGSTKLSDWQKEVLIYLGKDKLKEWEAIQVMLKAANGSGKSQFILAPFAIWMALRFIESLTIITTASGNQLDAQDLRYCTRLAKKINEFHKNDFDGAEVFDCKYRQFLCNPTQSHINLFATDESGKAEGWHPLKPGGKFAIIVDEGKTVADEIYEALERCTGFTHRLEISSAGPSIGQFYQTWQNLELDNSIFKKRITAFDCPHISVESINQRITKYGLFHPHIRNSIFSEFTSADQQVVITREMLSKAIAMCDRFYKFGPHFRAGLDLAAGGDETVMSVWEGNKEIAMLAYRNRDTIESTNQIIEFFKTFKGKLKQEDVIADDGGMGRPILDNLREKGYKFRRQLNQTRARDFTHYGNRGTEVWFNFKRFIEEGMVLFLKDEKGGIDKDLFSQLTNRYYKMQSGNAKLQLEPKQNAKKEGHPSPDRADAVVLAWSDYCYPIEEMVGLAKDATIKTGKTPEEVAREIEEQNMLGFRSVFNGDSVKPQLKQYNKRQLGNIGTGMTGFSHRKIYNFGKGNNKYAR